MALLNWRTALGTCVKPYRRTHGSSTRMRWHMGLATGVMALVQRRMVRGTCVELGLRTHDS